MSVGRAERALERVRKLRRQVNLGQVEKRLREKLAQRKRASQARKEYELEVARLRKRFESLEQLVEEQEAGTWAPDPDWLREQEKELREIGRDIHRADHRGDQHQTAFSRLTRAIQKTIRPLVKRRRVRAKKLDKAISHRRRVLRREKRQERRRKPASGVATFDGKPVAAWMVPILQRARANGWGGTLTSGYRSPEYSRQLCIGICGAPVCPSRCAGTTSNHTKLDSNAAVDVSDPAGFDRAQDDIWNALGAADPWHFSKSGR